MSDAFDNYEDRIGAYREKLKYVDGATGVAVAIGEKVVAIDDVVLEVGGFQSEDFETITPFSFMIESPTMGKSRSR